MATGIVLTLIGIWLLMFVVRGNLVGKVMGG